MSQIFDAICGGNLEEVKHIVNGDPECVYIQNKYGRTPLDVAIAWGNLEMVQFLFKKGGRPNLDIYYDGEWTPMHIAACNERIETLKWLFTENVFSLDVLNIKNKNGWTPLDVAISNGKLEIAKYLWEIGGRPNFEIYCDRNWAPVHEAVHYCHIATLKWVLEKGISRNVLHTKNSDGWTSLDVAIACGNLEMAKYLWEMGGRPNLEFHCRDGKNTPVHKVVERGYITTLKWIFKENILPLSVLNIKDRDGKTPMNQAIALKLVRTVDLLGHFYIDSVFLAMQRAKRDHYQCCVLRRLPDELLDMVVNKVAVRFHLEVVW